MTHAALEKFLLLADRMILSNNPGEAEYGRGYQSGIKFYFDIGQHRFLPDHYCIAEIARRNGSRDVHAYVRGHHDGCMGLDPDMNFPLFFAEKERVQESVTV